MKQLRKIAFSALLGAALAASSGCTTKFSFDKLSASLVSHDLKTISGQYKFMTAFNQGKVWIVTKTPYSVYEISLDPAHNYPIKTWTYDAAGKTTNGTGSRTYVSSIGLLFARLPATLFLVSDTTPTTAPLAPVWQASNPAGNTRVCTTSYQVNKNAYVGIAWTNSGGNRVFTQIPINPSLPNSLDLSNEKDVVLGPDVAAVNLGWAYGCFTDQARNTFWTSTPYGNLNSPIYGVNLNTLTDVSASSAPNAGHPLQAGPSLAPYFGDPAQGSGSYALSGDAYGNVLVAMFGQSSIYTFAHETSNNITIGSINSGAAILAFPSACASGTTDCTGKVAMISTSGSGGIGTGAIGPLSSLNDGRVIGVNRGGSSSSVYVLAPAVPTDLTQGMKATKIAVVSGDAYMYTDFTGATLYPSPVDQTYDLTQLQGYDSSKPFAAVSINWTAESGLPEAWAGLKLTARCFNSATQGSTSLVQVTPVLNGGQATPILVPSCQSPGFDHLEIAVVSDGSAAFTRASSITLMAQQ